jgi:copper chaperone CopZ
MAEIELKIKGMSCPHCEMRIKKVLEKVGGVKEATVDHKTGAAWVTLREGAQVEAQKLIDVINATEIYTAEKA